MGNSMVIVPEVGTTLLAMAKELWNAVFTSSMEKVDLSINQRSRLKNVSVQRTGLQQR
jgi:hypothetical protein